MNVLEKILEEIKQPTNYTIMCGKHFTTIDRVEEIIHSHMDEDFTQWIPYTVQNIPKKEGLYFVTCDDEKYPVKRMRFKNGIWLWNYGIYDGKILAWQPFPEPYKSDVQRRNNHVK